MSTEIVSTLIVLLVIAVWAVTHFIVSLRWKARLSSSEARNQSLERMISEKDNDVRVRVEEIRKHYEQSIAQMRSDEEKHLQQQISAMKESMAARTEEILKAREEEISRKAQETFSNISGGLGKDIKEMKEAFEANKKASLESSTSIKERFDSAVKSLEEKSKEIGGKADRLADALRGQKKMQGCWGETILDNLLTAEGLIEGRDYERESTIRDDLGFTILNEDTDKKMRPDYILHLPDNNDIVIDAKVSLSAFADYVEATDEQGKKEASARNAAAIKEQVKRLARKNYDRYLLSGHRMLDYVLMFVPNYPALQLAYNEDPSIWRDAYSQGVLITSQETLMPFLRMISIAWTNVEQVKNQQQIISSAQMMIDRVADFCKAHAEMGKKLDEAKECYDHCSDKLKDSGRSIVQSARQVVKLGVPQNPKKPLPEV